MIKRILVLALSLVILSGLIVCGVNLFNGDSDSKGYPAYQETEVKKLEDGMICENQQFELQWDQKNKRVILYDKETNTRWCNTPEEELDNNPIESGEKTHPQVDSPIYVTYFDNVNFAEKTVYAATGAIKNGSVSAEKTEKGLSVTYNFEKEQFSVTVEYTLQEDHLQVSVDTSKITENADNIVTEVSVAPFFCSVKNDTQDAYLFVPSGSGALIYSDVRVSSAVTTSEKVYGQDYSVDDADDFVKYESVRLPVYGAVNQNRGVCAIIEEGAEGANICTVSNNTGMGYAAVYASFMTRGYDLIDRPKGFSSTTVKNKLYSEPVMNQVYSIGFYPFYGEDASYVDMANIYRGYLEKEYGFTKDASLAQENAVNLNLVGAAEGREFLFGVPYSKLYATTTLKEAKEMINEVREIAGDINVSLQGFTKSGVNTGEPAGGIQIASKLGSYKELKQMYDSYGDTDTSLFLDFDSVCFNESGSGISTYFGSALTTNGKQATLTVKSQETGMPDSNQENYKLVSRQKLETLNAKILKKLTKKGISGIGLSTLSKMAYADYSDENCYVALGMGEQVRAIFTAYKEAGIPVMGSSANAYAAVSSDYIADVPTTSSGYESFDVEVPFYELVFKGYVPMSVSALNLSPDADRTLLKALESGVGLSFTAIKQYDEELVNSSRRDFYGTNKENVLSELKLLKEEGVIDILNELKGTGIAGHTVVNASVRKTEFSNGITIYVNYGEDAYTEGDITVSPNHYYVER